MNKFQFHTIEFMNNFRFHTIVYKLLFAFFLCALVMIVYFEIPGFLEANEVARRMRLSDSLDRIQEVYRTDPSIISMPLAEASGAPIVEHISDDMKNRYLLRDDNLSGINIIATGDLIVIYADSYGDGLSLIAEIMKRGADFRVNDFIFDPTNGLDTGVGRKLSFGLFRVLN